MQKNVNCLLDAYSPEILQYVADDRNVCKFSIVQETWSRTRKTALGLEFRCGTEALAINNGRSWGIYDRSMAVCDFRYSQ
jgi:hypothetical protein